MGVFTRGRRRATHVEVLVSLQAFLLSDSEVVILGTVRNYSPYALTAQIGVEGCVKCSWFPEVVRVASLGERSVSGLCEFEEVPRRVRAEVVGRLEDGTPVRVVREVRVV